MHRGELIGSERSAEVLAVDGRWVLRRYRDGMDARPEAVVMAHLAAAGFPVPRVRAPDAGVQHTELVMQRLSGPTLLEAVQQGTFGIRAAGALLGDLLRRLHDVPPHVGAEPGAREMLCGLVGALGPDAAPDTGRLAQATARRAANPTMSDAELGLLDDAAALVRTVGGGVG